MVKELLGTAITDENGVATFTYTGTGRGKMNIVAESGSLVSETFVLYDCIILDRGTDTDHNSNWNATNGLTYSDTASTLTITSSTFRRITTSITGDFEALFKAYTTGGGWRITLYNASNTNQSLFAVFEQSNEKLVRVRRVNGVFTFAYSSDNGETWTNLSINSQSASLTTEDVYFGFGAGTSAQRSITYRDIMIYPI